MTTGRINQVTTRTAWEPRGSESAVTQPASARRTGTSTTRATAVRATDSTGCSSSSIFPNQILAHKFTNWNQNRAARPVSGTPGRVDRRSARQQNDTATLDSVTTQTHCSGSRGSHPGSVQSQTEQTATERHQSAMQCAWMNHCKHQSARHP